MQLSYLFVVLIQVVFGFLSTDRSAYREIGLDELGIALRVPFKSRSSPSFIRVLRKMESVAGVKAYIFGRPNVEITYDWLSEVSCIVVGHMEDFNPEWLTGRDIQERYSELLCYVSLGSQYSSVNVAFMGISKGTSIAKKPFLKRVTVRFMGPSLQILGDRGIVLFQVDNIIVDDSYNRHAMKLFIEKMKHSRQPPIELADSVELVSMVHSKVYTSHPFQNATMESVSCMPMPFHYTPGGQELCTILFRDKVGWRFVGRFIGHVKSETYKFQIKPGGGTWTYNNATRQIERGGVSISVAILHYYLLGTLEDIYKQILSLEK